LKKIREFFIQNLYNLISTTENIDKFESYLRAKHTKDSKEFHRRKPAQTGYFQYPRKMTF
jgi:hypothetical protein